MVKYHAEQAPEGQRKKIGALSKMLRKPILAYCSFRISIHVAERHVGFPDSNPQLWPKKRLKSGYVPVVGCDKSRIHRYDVSAFIMDGDSIIMAADIIVTWKKVTSCFGGRRIHSDNARHTGTHNCNAPFFFNVFRLLQASAVDYKRLDVRDFRFIIFDPVQILAVDLCRTRGLLSVR